MHQEGRITEHLLADRGMTWLMAPRDNVAQSGLMMPVERSVHRAHIAFLG